MYGARSVVNGEDGFDSRLHTCNPSNRRGTVRCNGSCVATGHEQTTNKRNALQMTYWCVVERYFPLLKGWTRFESVGFQHGTLVYGLHSIVPFCALFSVDHLSRDA